MTPDKNMGISIDEILKSCKSFRNPLRICMRTKRDKEGIKGYLLCDNRTSYTYNLQIQFPSQFQNRSHRSITGLVLSMTQKFIKSGVKLIGDRYYTSLDLMKNLYDRGIPYLGTAMKTRLNRFFRNPDILTKLSKNTGAFTRKLYVFWSKINGTLGKIFIFIYNDKKNKPGTFFVTNDKSLINMDDREDVRVVNSDFTAVLENNDRPSVTNFYNLHMGGVDRFDQALHSFTICRQYRGENWYRRFISLVKDMEFINTFLVIKDILAENGEKIDRTDFYYILAHDFLKMLPAQNDTVDIVAENGPNLSKKRKLNSRQRCKFCHEEKSPKRTKATTVCGLCESPICREKHTAYLVCTKCSV